MSPWYALVRKYVALGLKLYFRDIRMPGAENIPASGPVIFTVNHQNAFLDALLVATSNQRHTHFLVRADVFRFRLIRMFFSSLNMMPIYRIRDGRHSLINNHEIFEQCIAVLGQGQALMLFPEADHHQKRLLLPLSKGFTRIALGMDHPVQIVPVGLNYTHHRSFGGSVSLNYGKPISTKTYSDQRALRQKVNNQMQQLITSIPDDEYYQQYEDYLNRDRSQYLDPDRCNQWIARNKPGDIPQISHPRSAGSLRTMILAVSTVLNFLPAAIYHLLLKKINDPVFSSSIKFMTGIIILPLYYLLMGAILYLLWGPVIACLGLGLGMLSLIARKFSLR